MLDRKYLLGNSTEEYLAASVMAVPRDKLEAAWRESMRNLGVIKVQSASGLGERDMTR